jgi:hypothetical protein
LKDLAALLPAELYFTARLFIVHKDVNNLARAVIVFYFSKPIFIVNNYHAPPADLFYRR